MCRAQSVFYLVAVLVQLHVLCCRKKKKCRDVTRLGDRTRNGCMPVSVVFGEETTEYHVQGCDLTASANNEQ